VLALPDSLNAEKLASYVVEGIGYDFVPDVLSREPGLIDSWVKTADTQAFSTVRTLMRCEGTLVGGSSGSSLSGALAWLHSDAGRQIAQTEGKNVVVLLPDGCVWHLVNILSYSLTLAFVLRIRNYIGKDWFLKMTLEAPQTSLAKQITSILKRPRGEDVHANRLNPDGTKMTNGVH
jgi:cystathionine beta-synthase